MQRESFIQFVPLLIFTALLIAAAGVAAALAAAHLFIAQAWPAEPLLFTIALFLSVTGGLFSLFHLGRKERAARAGLGLAHSWLSREAVLAGLFTAGVATSLLFIIFSAPVWWFTAALVVTAISGVAVVIAVGMVYNLDAQEGWRGLMHALVPLITALLLAAALVMTAPGGLEYRIYFYGAAIVDAILLIVRIYRHGVLLLRDAALFLFPGFARFAMIVYLLRAAALAAAALTLGQGASAASFVVIGIGLDRFSFYAGAAQRTPGVEISLLKAERMEEARRVPVPSPNSSNNPTYGSQA